jgi:hypothetical protein
VIACSRVEHDHWKNDRALAEARALGMYWFEKAIQAYVLAFQPRDLVPAVKTLNASSALP